MTTRTRLLFLALSLAVAASSGAGCKKDKGKTPAADDSKAGTTPTEPTPPPPTEPPPPAAPQVIKIDGFQTPESVLYDDQADVYLVSNINGTPFDKDDNGFIAKVSPPPDAKLAEPAWIDGKNEKVTLNAPKGMAFLGDVLYVADIDVVRMFDRKSGEPKGEVKLKGATFLNDVAAGKDSIYVTDTALDKQFKPGKTQGVWQIKGNKGTQIAKGADFGGPNGVLVQGDDVWVVTFGSGELYKLGKGGKREAVEKLPKGQLDGIVAGADGTLYVTSWEGSSVFHGKPGSWTEAPLNVKGPADLAIDTKHNVLVIPVFQENRVEIHEVPRGGDAGAAAPAATAPGEAAGDKPPAEEPVEGEPPAGDKGGAKPADDQKAPK